jgi:hypothetical protein
MRIRLQDNFNHPRRFLSIGGDWGDEDHSQRGFNFHPVFIPLNQLLAAIWDCGFWIADLSYRCALSVFIKLTEYLKSKI